MTSPWSSEIDVIAEEIEKWKYLIGSIILEFGEIELATRQLMVYYGNKLERTQSFKTRCDRIIGLIGRDVSLDESQREYIKENKIISFGEPGEFLKKNGGAH